MATITTNRAFDMTQFDFSELHENFVGGARTLDPLVSLGLISRNDSFLNTTLLVGSDLSFSGLAEFYTLGGGGIRSGSVTTLFVATWEIPAGLRGASDTDLVLSFSESDPSEWWVVQIDGFSHPGKAISDAAVTRSTSDEKAILRSILSGNDTFELSGFDDRAYGYGGNDTMIGGAGDDRLYGGAGNDILDDGTGTDYVDGGSGIDTFQRNLSQDYGDYAFTTVVDLTAGKFYAVGYENDFDTLVSIENVDMKGNFDDRIYGTSGKNTLRGNNGNDLLNGRNGNDVLNGGNNNDTLIGGAGNDTLIGGAGADRLLGGAGRDRLDGDSGADRFVFERAGDAGKGASRDVILDFSRSEGDRIDLKAIDARSGTRADDAFVFIGGKGFSKKAGELRYDRAKKLVQADTNGDGRADFELRIDNGAALDGGDFIL